MSSRIPPRRSAMRTTHAVPVPVPRPDIEEDERYYNTALTRSSVRRYTNTEGHEVYQQGKRRLVIHQEAPPRRTHWLVPLGAGMLLLLPLFLGANWIVSAWQAHQLDATYGMPRTWQTDAVVGHHDSAAHPSHFIFENLDDHVVIIEIPGGDLSHTRVYAGPVLGGQDASGIPVTGSFQDVNGDGKPDLIVHLQDQTLVYLNDGTQFKSQS